MLQSSGGEGGHVEVRWVHILGSRQCSAKVLEGEPIS